MEYEIKWEGYDDPTGEPEYLAFPLVWLKYLFNNEELCQIFLGLSWFTIK